MFWLLLWTAVIVLVLHRLYRWSTEKIGLWEAKGVKCVKPYPILGSYPSSILGKKAMIEGFKQLYKDLGENDLAVYYFFTSPTLLVNDPELIREVTVKNFDHYVDRVVVKELVDVHKDMDKMLTVLSGDEWKTMRAGLSPAFTTGKLKTIVGAMNKAGPDLNKYIAHQLVKGKGVVEMREVFGRYTMGVIAHAVYGIDAKVFDEVESEFVKNARSIQSQLNLRIIVAFVMYLLVPRLAKALKVRFFPREPFIFFEEVTKSIMTMRKQEGRASDMLQVLIDLRNKEGEKEEVVVEEEQFEADAALKDMKVDPKSVISEDGIIQSAVLFLLGGFDTTANTLSLIAYYLATNPEVQEKAREEVDAVGEEEDQQLSYEDISRLEYLDMVVSESLRIAPIASMVERQCTKEHTLSNGVKVEEGTRVQIAIIGLHMDPKYWSDPETFDPERFNKENKRRITPYTYLPFGAGPRNCIGMRFALMEVKVALFHLLRGFVLEPSDKTTVPPKFDVKVPLTAIAGGNHLRLVPRNNE